MNDHLKDTPANCDLNQQIFTDDTASLSGDRSKASVGLGLTKCDGPAISASPSYSPREAGNIKYQSMSLNGLWSAAALPLDAEGKSGYQALSYSASEIIVAAQVPGEIHLDLMRAGSMEDPDVSDNARTRCRWPEWHSWWYCIKFTLSVGFREHWRQRLILDGIDLYGQVFVNGVFVASSKNAFAPLDIDVKGALREGENEVVVRVTSGMELPRPAHYPPLPYEFMSKLDPVHGEFRMQPNDQRRFLRKPTHSAHGFDFCDPLPNIGIWRGVHLEARSYVAIDHLRLDTVIRGDDVFLEGEIHIENLHPWGELPIALELRIDPPTGSSIMHRVFVDAQVGRSAVPCTIRIPDPQLWWPNGMGGQPLYKLTASAVSNGMETDRHTQLVGLRTIEIERARLPEGSGFCFRVNGQKVYCKGGNWAPPDLISARMDTGRYEKLVTEAANANFTMLRAQGTGFYEHDAFYHACDRAGILVWQDFAFACAQYPELDEEFLASVRREAEATVKRLRHHASLALWCGNNENTWFMQRDWHCTPHQSDQCGGARIYNDVLPDICRHYDPVRRYWPGSPAGGTEDPNSELSGDTHWWSGSIFSLSDARLSQEAADKCRARFVSEYGALGPPHIDSMREYLKPDELSRASIGWKIHTNFCDPMQDVVASGIRNHYADPEKLTLEQYVLYGQMVQAQLHGRVVDAMRFRKNDPRDDCQGVLVWSYSDTWGEVGWSIIDHYMRRKAGYYWFRRSAAHVKVLVRARGGHLVIRVVNDTLATYHGVVRCGWIRLDGMDRDLHKHLITIPANGMVEVTHTALPSSSERDPREWLYAAMLTGEGIPADQAIWLLAPHRQLALPQPRITTEFRDGMLKVSSAVYCHGVHLEDGGYEVLEDNYFDLLPGVPRYIRTKTPPVAGSSGLAAVMPIVST